MQMYPLNLSITDEEYMLPITLQDGLNETICLKQTMLLGDFTTWFRHQQKIFSDQQRYIDQTIDHSENFLLNSIPLRIFFFIASILTVVILFAVIAWVCKHVKLKTLVVGLAVHQYQDKIKGINVLETNNTQPFVCSCKLEWWTICMLMISLVGVISYLFLKCKQRHLFKGYHYLNASHLMLFASDHLQVCSYQAWESITRYGLFKLIGHNDNVTITLWKSLIWNTLEIDWSQVNILVNQKELI